MKTNKIISLESKRRKKPLKKPTKKAGQKTSAKGKVISFKSKSKTLTTEETFIKLNKNISVAERNKIIVKYLPMIRCIARKISSRLPAHIDYEDLISSGVMGLMDAINKYDSSRNNKFKTYAEFRVHGSILDSLRSQDWIPRSIRDKTKKVNKVTKELELKLSRAPTSQEIADGLEVSLEKYHSILTETKKVNMVSIDESAFFNKTDKSSVLEILENKHSSFNALNQKSIQKIIQKCIEELPERQRMVLSLYYYEEFNLRKIGKILKVTESRVSQLHAQAIEKLKAKLVTQVKEEELKAA